jgi:hypothetical protein
MTNARTHWIIAASVVLFFAAYLGAYYALVFPGFYHTYLPGLQAPTPCYTHGSTYAEALFVPANWLDRMIRPHTWEEREM